VKGGDTRQEISCRGMGVMVSEQHPGKKVFGQPEVMEYE